MLWTSFRAALLLATFGLTSSSAGDLAASGSAQRPTPPLGAPAQSAITVSARLLVDRSHGETFDVSGLTTYLTANGWTVSQHAAGPLDAGALASADVLMVPVNTYSSIANFSAAEVAAITSWVAGGKGLWLFNEFWTPPFGINSLAGSFGVQFHADLLRDAVENRGDPVWPNITNLSVHAVTAGVSAFGYYAGACVTAAPPAQLVARGGSNAHSDDCPVQPGVLAVATYGSGRAAFCGDNTPLHPADYPSGLDAQERMLLQNIANWLAGGSGPTVATRASWAQVKSIYR